MDDTLVIVTSDHGEEFLEHGRLVHGMTHYEEMLRVPLFLVGPGVPPGSRISTPVSLVDLLPTVLGLLEIPAPAGIDGRDLAPLWRGEAEAFEDRMLLAETGSTQGAPWNDALRSIRQGDMKLIVDSVEGRSELFDLAQDPGEQRNLADARPEVVESLAAALDAELGAKREPATAAEPSEDVKRRLKALGYLPEGT